MSSVIPVYPAAAIAAAVSRKAISLATFVFYILCCCLINTAIGNTFFAGTAVSIFFTLYASKISSTNFATYTRNSRRTFLTVAIDTSQTVRTRSIRCAAFTKIILAGSSNAAAVGIADIAPIFAAASDIENAAGIGVFFTASYIIHRVINTIFQNIVSRRTGINITFILRITALIAIRTRS